MFGLMKSGVKKTNAEKITVEGNDREKKWKEICRKDKWTE